MKAWITKYALTQGIFVKEAEINLAPDSRMITIKSISYRKEYYCKPDWYETEAEARANAEDRRQAKLCSLKKQIDYIEKLVISVSP